MQTNLSVYVSSTSIDLKGHRAAVIAALRKMGMLPVCMEDYVAQDNLPVEKCLADVAKSEVYIGIFAWRYGFKPKGYNDKSITELEYRKAIEFGIPALTFLLDESAEWPAEYRDKQQDAKRISDLRDELKLDRMVGWFTSPEKLAIEVVSAVHINFKDRLEKALSDRYAEVSVATTPEKEASLRHALEILQESVKQQDLRAQQNQRDPIPIQLPKLRGTFVDREKERDTLYYCLRAVERKLVVIVAPGGFGKTELTTKVLKEIAPGSTIAGNDIQGILYLKCVRGDVSLGQIFSEAGRIAGKKKEFCEIYANKQMTLARKLEYFFSEISRVGNVLIVMDNFEDLLDPADDSIRNDELREFLETAAEVDHTVRIIVTSRAVPRFKGSRKIEKIDLSTGLPEDQAIRYLREEGAEFGLDKEDERALRSFVRRVYGIPKALESVIGYLEDHFPAIRFKDILANKALFEDFDRYDLEKGIKSLIFQQLKNQPPDAQLVLSAISIFEKPVPQAALRYLLQGIEEVEFAALLTRLEKNRLLIQSGGLYDLHPIVRTFVYDRIPATDSASGEGNDKGHEASIFTRPALHQQAAGFHRKLEKPEKEWKNIGDLEPHIQEIHHLIRAGLYDNAERVLSVIEYDYLQLWGYYSHIIELREQLIDKLHDKDLHTNNLFGLGTCYNYIGKTIEAIRCYEIALEVEKQENDRSGMALSYNRLGWSYHTLGDFQEAIRNYEQALSVYKDIDIKKGESSTLNGLGITYNALNKPYMAIQCLDLALSIDRKIGDRRSESSSLSNLGNCFEALGEFQKAIEYNERAFTIHKELGDRFGEGVSLGNIAIIYIKSGVLHKAFDYIQDAYKIFLELGCQRELGVAQGTIGDYYIHIGKDQKAVVSINNAINIFRDIGDKRYLSNQCYDLGFLCHWMGNLKDAKDNYNRSLAHNFPSCNYKCAIMMGILFLKEGLAEKAKEFLILGVSLSKNNLAISQNLYDQMYMLALGLLASGHKDEAISAYEKAIIQCNAKGVVKMELMALDLLGRAFPECDGMPEIKAKLSELLT